MWLHNFLLDDWLLIGEGETLSSLHIKWQGQWTSVGVSKSMVTEKILVKIGGSQKKLTKCRKGTLEGQTGGR